LSTEEARTLAPVDVDVLFCICNFSGSALVDPKFKSYLCEIRTWQIFETFQNKLKVNIALFFDEM
jgi:hypothetical protein